jgi:hypothetical protein
MRPIPTSLPRNAESSEEGSLTELQADSWLELQGLKGGIFRCLPQNSRV